MFELIAFFAYTSFVAWVLFWGGAEWLEGTFTSGFLVHELAHRWSAEGIKLYVGLSWIGAVVLGLIKWFSYGHW